MARENLPLFRATKKTVYTQSRHIKSTYLAQFLVDISRHGACSDQPEYKLAVVSERMFAFRIFQFS